MLTNYEIPQCPICFDELTSSLSVTKCGHVFHRKCIEQSIRQNPMCPLDRASNSLENLRNLAYCIPIKQDDKTIEFFNDLPDDDKKSIQKLSLKLKDVLKEREKFQQKCVCLEQKNQENTKRIIDLEEQNQQLEQSAKQLENKNSSLNFKVEFHKSMLEDSERKIQLLEQEKMKQSNKILSLEQLHEIIKKIQDNQNKIEDSSKNNDNQENFQLTSVQKQIKWASDIRASKNFEQQATLFYESYRVQIIQNEHLTSSISKIKQENSKLKLFESEYEHFKKKYFDQVKINKLLKSDLENASKQKNNNENKFQESPEKQKAANIFQKQNQSQAENKKRKIDSEMDQINQIKNEDKEKIEINQNQKQNQSIPPHLKKFQQNNQNKTSFSFINNQKNNNISNQIQEQKNKVFVPFTSLQVNNNTQKVLNFVEIKK